MIRFLKNSVYTLFRQVGEWGLILICAYLGFIIMLSPGGVRLYKQLDMLKSEEALKLENTQLQIQDLQKKTQLLQEDKQYQAYEARVIWDLVKPGEDIIWYHQMED